METVQEQADVAEDSTPTAGDDSTSAQATAVAEPVETSAAGSVPAPAAKEVDPDRAAFDRLQAGEKPIDVRQNPKPIDPSPESSDQEQGATAKSKAEETAKSAAYQGTDPKNIDALRRAQLLPPDPATWNGMPPSTQKALIASARNLLKQKGQISQQLGQGTKAEQTNDTDDAGGEEDESAEDTGGTAGIPPQAAPQQPRGVRAQTQTAARPDAQPGLDAMFQGISDVLGEEAVKPLKDLLSQQQQSLTQSEQARAQYDRALQQQAAQLDGMARLHFLPEEREAFKTLEGETGGKISENDRNLILRNATIHFQASLSAPEPLTWNESVLLAGRSIKHLNIKQQAQAEMIDRRKQALRASPAKGNLSTRPDRAMSIDDRDKAAFEQLLAGRQAKDVRAALT